ncbi:sigma-70 family RNA polymerase sigma factor [Corallococcus sp. H22C18031201]|uniref:RNA polymerase sigma factor n=1 Tax=Citreicoccus inhibens TaxID=2849499 RepID=UPI000E739BE1|nr:sigma factor [Citreicoccus inhibens]MBU8897912.1 sigma-70 family RNA polymerase sigma factor [Citreicoccus inhibens]RJS17027.1 sigma-70 family RNA polymerase sigma factor [Corallococcus sp. H22C18031201]
MRYPSRTVASLLHERMLQRDPVATVDVLQSFMDPIRKALERRLSCSADDAHDSTIDALMSYLAAPEHFDASRGTSLGAYLTQAALKKAVDRWRKETARGQRELKFANVVELQARAPNDLMERYVEASQAVTRLAPPRMPERDWALLRDVLQGESSTQEMAVVLRLPLGPEHERRREVKRHRDRVMKRVARLGREDRDDES